MQCYEFDAVLQKHDQLDAVFVDFPHDVEREFGTRGRVKVVATFDGREYRGSLVPMGRPCHLIGLTKEIRGLIGKGPGDTVHVTIVRDTEPRRVEVPADLKSRLAVDEAARSFFESLSYSNQRLYVQWITEAKKAETRNKRLEGAIGMLRDGKKRP